MPEYIKTTGGYFYKTYKNGKSVRVSKDEFDRNNKIVGGTKFFSWGRTTSTGSTQPVQPGMQNNPMYKPKNSRASLQRQKSFMWTNQAPPQKLQIQGTTKQIKTVPNSVITEESVNGVKQLEEKIKQCDNNIHKLEEYRNELYANKDAIIKYRPTKSINSKNSNIQTSELVNPTTISKNGVQQLNEKIKECDKNISNLQTYKSELYANKDAIIKYRQTKSTNPTNPNVDTTKNAQNEQTAQSVIVSNGEYDPKIVGGYKFPSFWSNRKSTGSTNSVQSSRPSLQRQKGFTEINPQTSYGILKETEEWTNNKVNYSNNPIFSSDPNTQQLIENYSKKIKLINLINELKGLIKISRNNKYINYDQKKINSLNNKTLSSDINELEKMIEDIKKVYNQQHTYNGLLRKRIIQNFANKH
jgi:hypothetical protein